MEISDFYMTKHMEQGRKWVWLGWSLEWCRLQFLTEKQETSSSEGEEGGDQLISQHLQGLTDWCSQG